MKRAGKLVRSALLVALALALLATALPAFAATPDPISIQVTPSVMTLRMSRSARLSVSFFPAGSNSPLSWYSSDTSIATVSDNGVVTGISKGSTWIGAGTFNGKSSGCWVTVIPNDPERVCLPATRTINMGETITLQPVFTPTTADTTCKWHTSKPYVATVESTGHGGCGEITGVSVGTTIVTVTTHNGKKASCKIIVEPRGVDSFTAELLDFEGDNADYDGDGTYAALTGHALTVKIRDVYPPDAHKQFLFASTNTRVATVSNKGVVTCRAKGKAAIVVTAKYGGAQVVLPLNVFANETTRTVQQAFGTRDPFLENPGKVWLAAKHLYIKRGYLYVEFYVCNASSAPVRRLSRQRVYFTENASLPGSTRYIGTFKPKVKKAILPMTMGTVTIKMARMKQAETWLNNADAYLEGYWYSTKDEFDESSRQAIVAKK